MPAPIIHNPPHSISYGPNENCTLATCSVLTSVLRYRPSLAANAIFVALFGLSFVVHAVQGVRWRTWAFMVAMLLGCAVEMVGYGGRIMMYRNPFSFPGFITQIGTYARFLIWRRYAREEKTISELFLCLE
jgi:RTA1 like protein